MMYYIALAQRDVKAYNVRYTKEVMYKVFKQLIHPTAASRKFLAGLGAALLLFALFFSSAFITVESDHDCTGADCPICLDLRDCVNSFQQMGSPLPIGEIVPTEPILSSNPFCAHTVRVPAPTLHSLHVRLDE